MNDLTAEALQGVIEAFVLREGTDYGHRDYALAEKCQRVKDLLRSGQAEIRYYPETDFIDIAMR